MEEPRLIDVIIGASICAAAPSDFQLLAARLIYQQFRELQEDYRSLDLSLITMLFTIIDNPYTPLDDQSFPPVALFSLLKLNPALCPADLDVRDLSVYQDLYLRSDASVDAIFHTAIKATFFAQDVIHRLHLLYEISRTLEWPWYILDRLQRSKESSYIIMSSLTKKIVTQYIYQYRVSERISAKQVGGATKSTNSHTRTHVAATNVMDVLRQMGTSLFPNEHQRKKDEFFFDTNKQANADVSVDSGSFLLLQKFILFFCCNDGYASGNRASMRAKGWFTSQVLRYVGNDNVSGDVKKSDICRLFDMDNVWHQEQVRKHDSALMSCDIYNLIKLSTLHKVHIPIRSVIHHKLHDTLTMHLSLSRATKVVVKAVLSVVGAAPRNTFLLKTGKLTRNPMSTEDMQQKERSLFAYINTNVTVNMARMALDDDLGLLYDEDYDSEDSDGEYTFQCVSQAQKQRRATSDVMQSEKSVRGAVGCTLQSRIGYVVHGSIMGSSSKEVGQPVQQESVVTGSLGMNFEDDDDDDQSDDGGDNHNGLSSSMQTVKMTPMKGRPVTAEHHIERQGLLFAELDPTTQRLLLSNRVRRVWRYQRLFLRVLLRLPANHDAVTKLLRGALSAYCCDVNQLISSISPPTDRLTSSTTFDTHALHGAMHPRLQPRVSSLPPEVSQFVKTEKNSLVSVFQRPRPLFVDLTGAGADAMFIKPILAFLRAVLQMLHGSGVVTGIASSQLDSVTNGVELLEQDAFLGFPLGYLATSAIEYENTVPTAAAGITSKFIEMYRSKSSPFHTHNTQTQSNKSSVYGGFRRTSSNTSNNNADGNSIAQFLIGTMHHDFFIFLTSPARYYALLHRYACQSAQVMQTGAQLLPLYVQPFKASRTKLTPISNSTNTPNSSSVSNYDHAGSSVRTFLTSTSEQLQRQSMICNILPSADDFTVLTGVCSDATVYVEHWLTKRNARIERELILRRPLRDGDDSDEEKSQDKEKHPANKGYFSSFFGYTGTTADNNLESKRTTSTNMDANIVKLVPLSGKQHFELYSFAQLCFLWSTHSATWLQVLLQALRSCTWYVPQSTAVQDNNDIITQLQSTRVPVHLLMLDELKLVLQSTLGKRYPLHNTYQSSFFMKNVPFVKPLFGDSAVDKSSSTSNSIITAYDDLISCQTLYSTSGKQSSLSSKYVAATLSQIVSANDDVWDIHDVTRRLKSVLQSESKSSCHVAVKLLDQLTVRYHHPNKNDVVQRMKKVNNAQNCPIHRASIVTPVQALSADDIDPSSPSPTTNTSTNTTISTTTTSNDKQCECSLSPEVYSFDFLISMFEIDNQLYNNLQKEHRSGDRHDERVEECPVVDSDSNLAYFTKSLGHGKKKMNTNSQAALLQDYKHKEDEETGLLQAFEAGEVEKPLKMDRSPLLRSEQTMNKMKATAFDEYAQQPDDNPELVTSDISSSACIETTPFDDVLATRREMVRIKGVSFTGNSDQQCVCGLCSACLAEIAQGNMSTVVFLDPLGYNSSLSLCECSPGKEHSHKLTNNQCLCCARAVATMATLLPTLYALNQYYLSIGKLQFIHKYNNYLTFRANILQAHKYLLFGRMNNTRILHPKQVVPKLTPPTEFTTLFFLSNMTKCAITTCLVQAAAIDSVKYLERHLAVRIPNESHIVVSWMLDAERGILSTGLRQYIEAVWTFFDRSQRSRKQYSRGLAVESLGNSARGDVLARTQVVTVKNKYISPLLCEQELAQLCTAMVLIKKNSIPLPSLAELTLVRMLRLLPLVSVMCMHHPQLYTPLAEVLPSLTASLTAITSFIRYLQDKQRDAHAHEALQVELRRVSMLHRKNKRKTLLWELHK